MSSSPKLVTHSLRAIKLRRCETDHPFPIKLAIIPSSQEKCRKSTLDPITETEKSRSTTTLRL